MLSDGYSIVDISKWLGHATVMVTIYANKKLQTRACNRRKKQNPNDGSLLELGVRIVKTS
jgi:hypothetical protein